MTAVPPDKKDQYETAVELFVSMASLPPNDPSREKITTSIIELCLPLATHVARRYQGRGQPFEDLEQVARVGLIQAVQRFDVDKGSDFLSFAVPTVMGEVRKHFRDHGWSVRVPRSLQERHLASTGRSRLCPRRSAVHRQSRNSPRNSTSNRTRSNKV